MSSKRFPVKSRSGRHEEDLAGQEEGTTPAVQTIINPSRSKLDRLLRSAGKVRRHISKKQLKILSKYASLSR